MHAIRLRFGLSSLFSIRVPYAFQSALSYPLPPPSALLGMAAAALAAADGVAPLAALAQIDGQVAGVTATASGPIALRSHVVRVVNFDGKKCNRDALPRQFGWTPDPITAYWVVEDPAFARHLAAALSTAPLTLGDSESLLHPLECTVLEAQRTVVEPGQPVASDGYLPQGLLASPNRGTAYWVHERCDGGAETTPYLFPVEPDRGLLVPCQVTATAATAFPAVAVDGVLIPLNGARPVLGAGTRRRPVGQRRAPAPHHAGG